MEKPSFKTKHTTHNILVRTPRDCTFEPGSILLLSTPLKSVLQNFYPESMQAGKWKVPLPTAPSLGLWFYPERSRLLYFSSPSTPCGKSSVPGMWVQEVQGSSPTQPPLIEQNLYSMHSRPKNWGTPLSLNQFAFGTVVLHQEDNLIKTEATISLQ